MYELCLKSHRIPRYFADVPTGIRVVTNESDTIRFQALLIYPEKFFAHRLRHPRVNTVCDDEVELAKFFRHILHHVEMMKFYVRHTDRLCILICFVDSRTREVHADTKTIRHGVSDRKQIRPIATTKFQYRSEERRVGKECRSGW